MKPTIRKCTIRFRKPVAQISDRAKRYRAKNCAVRPPAPKQCGYCGSKRNVEVEHINGRESDGAAENLMWACRKCNVVVGNRKRKARIGKLVSQTNPAKGQSRRALMDAYGAAIKVMRGQFEGDVSKAVATIRATPRDIRSAYTRRTWPTRRALYGVSGRQSEIPF